MHAHGWRSSSAIAIQVDTCVKLLSLSVECILMLLYFIRWAAGHGHAGLIKSAVQYAVTLRYSTLTTAHARRSLLMKVIDAVVSVINVPDAPFDYIYCGC